MMEHTEMVKSWKRGEIKRGRPKKNQKVKGKKDDGGN